MQSACRRIEVEETRFHRNVLRVLGVTRGPRVGIVRETYACAIVDAAVDHWRLFERAAGFAHGFSFLRQRTPEPDDFSEWIPMPINTHACVLAADGTALVMGASTSDLGRRSSRNTIDSNAVQQAPFLYMSFLYMSPNMYKRGRWSTQEDAWSLGVVLCELASGGRPAYGTRTAAAVASGVAYDGLLPEIPREMSPSMRAIVVQCLKHEAHQRPLLASVVDLLTRCATRMRMAAICVALEWLELPALVSLHIIEYAVLESHTIPLHTQWAIIARVKHLLSLEEKARRRASNVQ